MEQTLPYGKGLLLFYIFGATQTYVQRMCGETRGVGQDGIREHDTINENLKEDETI